MTTRERRPLVKSPAPLVRPVNITRCSSFDVRQRCAEPAVAVVESKCAHGHVREGSVCLSHLSTVSFCLCATCHAYDIPHDCHLVVQQIRRTDTH